MSGKIPARRILVSRLRFLGDLVLTTPLIRVLRDNYPGAFIAYLAEEKYAPILLNNPDLDEIISFDLDRYLSLPFYAGLWEQMRFVKRLRSFRFDMTVDLFCNPRSALLLALTRAEVRVGGRFRGRKQFYNVVVPQPDRTVSAVDFHLRSLQAIGIDVPRSQGKKRVRVFVNDGERDSARRFLASRGIPAGTPVFGLNPGGSWPEKLWEREKFARLADSVVERYGGHVVLFWGPGQWEIAEAVARGMKHEAVITPPTDLRFLSTLIEQCDVFISNDCGPMHVAVGVGTPTIGLFGPADPAIWFPYSQEDGHFPLLMYDGLWNESMKGKARALEAEDVLRCVDRILAQRGAEIGFRHTKRIGE